MTKLNEQQLKEIVQKALRDVADEIFTKSQENIVKMGITDTGFLLKSGIVEEGNDSIKIIYSAPYAESVEYGSTAHFPPIAPIQSWVKRKLGKGNFKESKKIAWAIATNISKQGIQPKPFLRNAAESVIK